MERKIVDQAPGIGGRPFPPPKRSLTVPSNLVHVEGNLASWQSIGLQLT